VLALADIPGSIRRKVRMNRNRAGRAGGYAIEAAGLAGFPTLARLHEARWPGVADPAVLAKLEAALPGLDEAGLLRLAVLRIGGEAAAAILALVAPGRIYFYLSGYDPGQAFVSPGTILLAAMLDEALQEGRTEAHFLRGTEGYKYAWGAVDRVNRDGAFVWCDG
jgi:CelD/BcsL family acetyltransferase involved in cellulose biosynthesis